MQVANWECGPSWSEVIRINHDNELFNLESVISIQNLFNKLTYRISNSTTSSLLKKHVNSLVEYRGSSMNLEHQNGFYLQIAQTSLFCSVPVFGAIFRIVVFTIFVLSRLVQCQRINLFLTLKLRISDRLDYSLPST